MRLIAAFSIFTLLAAPAFAKAERYEFDKPHTTILFFVSHLGFSDMVGKFSTFDGHFTFDQQTPTNSSIDVTIRPSGIKTSSEALDEKLQSDKFFNSATFPEIKFKSREVKVTGEKTGDVTGDLTLLGVTKPVTLHVTFNKADFHPFSDGYVAGFSAEATLKRSDFGMKEYLPMVGDEVRIVIHTEGMTTERTKPAIQKTH